MKDFWENPIVLEYLFYDTTGIDRIVEKYGKCTNDYEIKIEYSIVDLFLSLKKDIVIEISREEYDNFIDGRQNNVYRLHNLEYDDFKDVFDYNLFDDLKRNIVPNTQSDFILFVKETFYNFKFDNQAKMFFRDLISYLNKYNHLLIKNDDGLFEKNTIQEFVANIYAENYLDTIQKIKNNYKMIFPEIENYFGLDFEIIEIYSHYANINKYQEVKEILKKEKLKKTIEQYVNNVSDEKEFLNELKDSFSTEKGRDIRIIIDYLKNEKIFIIQDRENKNFIEALGKHFDRYIGTKQGILDTMIITPEKKEPIEYKLKQIINKYKNTN